jgi:two-component system sensor histidine kinase VicK
LITHSRKEVTEVLYGNENIVKKTLETFSWIQSSLEGCIDHTEVRMHVTTQPIWDGLNQLRERGVKLRMVTEITNDNISYTKKMMQIAEVRHLKGVRSSFGIADGIQYLDHAISDINELSHAIISDVKAIVEAKEYLFETLWNLAIPAEQATMEIEEGIERSKTEIIQDTKISIARSIDIIKSAKEEVLVIWATSKTFAIGMNKGLAELYTHAIRNGAKVRLLIPFGESLEDTTDNLKKAVPQLDIRIADKSLETKITILIVDKGEVMTWELRDDNLKDPYQAGGEATYSNNKSIATSYAIIFETFWKQTELYEQSQTYIKMQNEFINIAAHELRTPVQPIIGLSQILLSKRGKIEDHVELIQTISRNAKRLQRLTEDILDVTKIESHSLHLNSEIFELGELISNIVRDFGIQINGEDSKGLKINYEDEAGREDQKKSSFVVKADKARISQVIVHLLDNAIKFTGEGSITINLKKQENSTSSSFSKHNQTIGIVSIKDSGSGIDSDIMPRLFEKFASKSFQGTGLGLFISKKIIEAHGGKIWSENNRDQKGATFYFSLPIFSNIRK